MLRNGKTRVSGPSQGPDNGSSTPQTGTGTIGTVSFSSLHPDVAIEPAMPTAVEVHSDVAQVPAMPAQTDENPAVGAVSTRVEDDEDFTSNSDSNVSVRRSKYILGEDGTKHPVAASVKSTSDEQGSGNNHLTITGPRQFTSEFGESSGEEDGAGDGLHVEQTFRTALAALTPNQREKVLDRVRKVAKKNKSRRSHSKERKIYKVKQTRVNSRSPTRSASPAAVAGPSYLQKGKMRAVDVEGTDLAQLDADREIAAALQRRLDEEPFPNDEVHQSRIPVVRTEGEKRKKRKVSRSRKSRSRSPKHKSRKEKSMPTRMREIEEMVPRKSTTPRLAVPVDVSYFAASNQLPGGYLGKKFAPKVSIKGSKNAKKKERRVETDRSRSKSRSRRIDEEGLPGSSNSSSEKVNNDREDGFRSPDGSGDGSSDSSSSESESSSSSESESTQTEPSIKEEKRKTHRGKRGRSRSRAKRHRRGDDYVEEPKRALKFPEPTSYDGRVNLVAFEALVFEFSSWTLMTKVDPHLRILALKKFLSGKAGEHYMATAAVSPRKYRDVEKYFKELYNHCFPYHFRQQMRSKFLESVQGGKSTREFLQKLRYLAERLPDISEMQVIHQFWEGSAQYIRVEWAKAGYSSETSTLAELEEAAERFESAEELRKKEDRGPKTDRGREQNKGSQQGDHRRNRTENFKRNGEGNRSGQPNGGGQNRNQGSGPAEKQKDHGNNNRGRDNNRGGKTPQRGNTHRKSYEDRPREAKLTPEEKDELRAARKCFTCKEVGHMGKDCPKNNSAPRPRNLGLGTVQLIEVEKLADKERAVAGVGLRSVNGINGRATTMLDVARAYRAPLIRSLMLAEPFPGDEWAVPLNDEIERWMVSISVAGDYYMIEDNLMDCGLKTIDVMNVKGFIDENPYQIFALNEFKSERAEKLASATLCEWVLRPRMIAAFTESLNDPNTGYRDLPGRAIAAPQGDRFYIMCDSDNTFIIEDLFPDPDEYYRGDDGMYRLSRRTISNAPPKSFNVVDYIHDEQWVRRNLVQQISRGIPFPSDAWATVNASVDPENRWQVYHGADDAYYIYDRLTEDTFPVLRDMAHDMDRNGAELGEWMKEQQRTEHGWVNPNTGEVFHPDDDYSDGSDDDDNPPGGGYNPGGGWGGSDADWGDDDNWNALPSWGSDYDGWGNNSGNRSDGSSDRSLDELVVDNPWGHVYEALARSEPDTSDDALPELAYASDSTSMCSYKSLAVASCLTDLDDDEVPRVWIPLRRNESVTRIVDSEGVPRRSTQQRCTVDIESVTDEGTDVEVDPKREHICVGYGGPMVADVHVRTRDNRLPINGQPKARLYECEMEQVDYSEYLSTAPFDRQREEKRMNVGRMPIIHMAAVSKDKKPQSSKKEKTVDRLERNSAKTKDFNRVIPTAIIIEVKVNGFPARALVDTGSLADFMSTKIVDQLRLKTDKLEKPLAVQLAVKGSRTIVNECVGVNLKVQGSEEFRRFDIMNLDEYDLILGTPWLFQHKIGIGFNPSKIVIGSTTPLPIEGEEVAVIHSRAADVLQGELDKIREQLKAEASDLCKGVAETDLPPMRAVNHTIPLIDESKVYHWRPSKCPEAMRPLWHDKRDGYIKSGRWRFRTGNNASPLLILWKPKPGPDGKKKIRTVVDKREQNANTIKMSSPLPDMEIMMRNAAKAKYRSLMDGQDAYEQIRIVPEHVGRSLFNTPDGTMESLVLQQGDCNGGATYQSLMNHIFGAYIGVFMYVYLDDILIYSDTIADHIKHIRIVLDILRKEKLYLSSDKMKFFQKELVILGHIIDDHGIRMDPHKVDSVANWKAPTNKELLGAFLGSVGYLANGVQNVRIPMAVLTPLTGKDKSFRWGPTEQRAFDDIKNLVVEHRNKHRVTIDYAKGAPWINLTCDASLTGAGGHISQGNDLETAKNVAFWSGKFNPAQQNYPTHERELLAIVESLKRFKHLLMGAKFRIFTDHRSLENLTNQKNLSPRQARWLETLCEFDYDIHYLPGDQNTLSDALSRVYSNEEDSTIRAKSEYLIAEADEEDQRADAREGLSAAFRTTRPLYTSPMSMPHLMVAGAVESGDSPRRSSRLRKPTKTADHDYERLYDNAKRTVKPNANAKASGSKDVFREEEPSPPQVEIEHVDTEIQPTPNVKRSGRGKSGKKDARPNVEKDVTPEPKEQAPPSQAVQTESSGQAASPETLPSLVASGEGIDVYGSIRGRYGEDGLLKDVIANPERHRNFEHRDGLIYLIDGKARMLCVPEIKVGKRRLREIIITHAHSLLAHLGSRKTMHYLREHVWWKGLQTDVDAYCATCQTCAATKTSTAKPFGELRSLDIPKRPWHTIGLDFVGPLPESKNRDGAFDMICVFIDHLTSMVHLVPCRQDYRAKDVAEMIFEHVYKAHGLPEVMVSDRDSYFTSTFWRHLHELIGTELRMSSAYHPQSDGLTERANRTMTQMLRQCVAPNQKDWVNKLPGIEFAMNSARSDTTGFSPFFLNYGRVPDPMIWEDSTDYPGVRVFAQRIKDAIMSAHDSIIAARVKQSTGANKHRRAAPFAKGDLVYLSTENLSIPKRRARKLVPKFIGPYAITEEIVGKSSYELDLPRELKQRGLHPVFHASLLRQHVANDDRRFPGREFKQLSAFAEEPKEWAVDSITSHFGSGTDALFKLKWKSGDETWCDFRTANKLEALRVYCDLMGVKSARDLGKGDSEEPTDEQIFVGPLFFRSDLYKDATETNSKRTHLPSTSMNGNTPQKAQTAPADDRKWGPGKPFNEIPDQDSILWDHRNASSMVNQYYGIKYEILNQARAPDRYLIWRLEEGAVPLAGVFAQLLSENVALKRTVEYHESRIKTEASRNTVVSEPVRQHWNRGGGRGRGGFGNHSNRRSDPYKKSDVAPSPETSSSSDLPRAMPEAPGFWWWRNQMWSVEDLRKGSNGQGQPRTPPNGFAAGGFPNGNAQNTNGFNTNGEAFQGFRAPPANAIEFGGANQFAVSDLLAPSEFGSEVQTPLATTPSGDAPAATPGIAMQGLQLQGEVQM